MGTSSYHQHGELDRACISSRPRLLVLLRPGAVCHSSQRGLGVACPLVIGSPGDSRIWAVGRVKSIWVCGACGVVLVLDPLICLGVLARSVAPPAKVPQADSAAATGPVTVLGGCMVARAVSVYK